MDDPTDPLLADDLEAFRLIVHNRCDVAIYRSLDDEEPQPVGTAFLIYRNDCQEARTVRYPLRYDDLFDEDLEMMIVNRDDFKEWRRAALETRIKPPVTA